MRAVEHAVDIWDLKGLDHRLSSGMLLEHLHDFERDGWELVWIALNADLLDHPGPCHVLVFKRVVEQHD